MSDGTQAETHQIVLTDKAAKVIHEAFDAEKVDKADSYVRVGARPGGCSGYKFDMDFADGGQVLENDRVFESHGIRPRIVAQHIENEKTCLETQQLSIQPRRFSVKHNFKRFQQATIGQHRIQTDELCHC